MKRIAEYLDRPLQWQQPHITDAAYELKSDEEVLATLRFRNSFGSMATGESANGKWTFKRMGFLNTYVSIRAEGSDKDIAVYRNNTWSEGGTLELPDGRHFKVNSNFWHSQFEFTSESGDPILQFTNIGGFKLHAQMELFQGSALLTELPWLVILGWYLTVMMYHDGGVVAALA